MPNHVSQNPITHHPTTVVVAADHLVVRIGIRNLLSRTRDIHDVGEASSSQEAFELVKELVPEVLILDLEMPGAEDVLRDLWEEHIPVRTVILSIHEDSRRFISELSKWGVCAYLPKEEAPQRVIDVIRNVAS